MYFAQKVGSYALLLMVFVHPNGMLCLAGGKNSRCGRGTRFLVFPSGGTASGTHTQMTWNTPAIGAVVADLEARGVVFEEYDSPEGKTINSVATLGQSKGAWFTDSEGNLLALGQFDEQVRDEGFSSPWRPTNRLTCSVSNMPAF